MEHSKNDNNNCYIFQYLVSKIFTYMNSFDRLKPERCRVQLEQRTHTCIVLGGSQAWRRALGNPSADSLPCKVPLVLVEEYVVNNC